MTYYYHPGITVSSWTFTDVVCVDDIAFLFSSASDTAASLFYVGTVVQPCKWLM